MELKYLLSKPYNFGEIVEDYLKVLKEKAEYDAWTINENLEIVECKGIIESNGSWNYHNNYDDSSLELYVIINKSKRPSWFSLNKDDVVKIQQENIDKWKILLNNELLRVDCLLA